MKDKLRRLKKILKSYKGLVLAYSGGVDSTFLLAIAARVLKDRLIAVTATSRLYPGSEVESARKMARRFQVRHRVIKTEELRDRRFVTNPPDRCYYCKRELFNKLKKIARRYGYEVADGTNYSDRRDFRPGKRAARELGIKSPLSEAGLTKEEIRILSKRLGLKTWDKPAMACLASRIPYGIKITRQIIEQIARAESFLKKMGVGTVRVRHHGLIARIETRPEDFYRIIKHHSKIVRRFRKIGFLYVTLELAGYQSGSMNRVLRKTKL
ncbi:MAG: ATP-dependent sacrificial sulfur transferase LarE [candidate division WOR-3 bacterium]